MLPEVLSNFACSLRPNEEKYTFSAIFEITETSQVVNQWFGRTVIYSDQRFGGSAVYHRNEGRHNSEEISITGTSYQVSAEIVAATLKMDECKILKQRMADGAITFDKVEVKFNLDEAGEPQGVYFKVSKMPII
jgi:ribonuclease R